MVIGREARSGRSLRRALFGSRSARADHLTGVYELSLHRALEPGNSILGYNTHIYKTRYKMTNGCVGDTHIHTTHIYTHTPTPLHTHTHTHFDI